MVCLLYGCIWSYAFCVLSKLVCRLESCGDLLLIPNPEYALDQFLEVGSRNQKFWNRPQGFPCAGKFGKYCPKALLLQM